MQKDTSNLIRAKEIQAMLNCSKPYAYSILNQFHRVTLSTTAKRPPVAILRVDFDKWLSDLKTNAVGGVND